MLRKVFEKIQESKWEHLINPYESNILEPQAQVKFPIIMIADGN